MSKALPFRLILVMAIACGFSIANIYYNQPLLGLLQREWGASPLIGLIPAMTQLGFAFGLILLVPLGDAMDRKRLILAQTLALIASLACMAASPTPPLLLLASVLVGATATIAQQIIPFAAELAGPEQRGKVVGHVMSGLLSGILLARTLSSFAGAYLGWRAMFMVGAALAIAMGLMLLAFLPSSKPTAQHGYPALLASPVQAGSRGKGTALRHPDPGHAIRRVQRLLEHLGLAAATTGVPYGQAARRACLASSAWSASCLRHRLASLQTRADLTASSSWGSRWLSRRFWSSAWRRT